MATTTSSSSRSEFWTTTIPGVANTWAVPIGPNLGEEVVSTLHVPQYANGEYIATQSQGLDRQDDLRPNRLRPGAESISFRNLAERCRRAIPGPGAKISPTRTSHDQFPSYTTVSEAPGVSIWVPRYGFILHVTHDLSLYGLYSQMNPGRSQQQPRLLQQPASQPAHHQPRGRNQVGLGPGAPGRERLGFPRGSSSPTRRSSAD